MRKIAVVYGGSSFHHTTYNEPKYRQYIEALIYLPELAETSLDDYDVILFPSQLHMKLVVSVKEKITEFANRGGIVVAFGPQPMEWIPNQRWENRVTNFWWWLDKDAKSGIYLKNEEHDLFQNYLRLADATWHQHGVFWPPEGTDTLIATDDGGSVLYIDKVSTEGTWIVMTLDPDFHFGLHFMPATERFLDGFLPWLQQGKI